MGGATGALLAGRYRVVRQLGQGGMGSVWLAEDTVLDNRQVAIKMLPSVLVSNKRAYKQIKSEALVSLKLSHPNIAPFRSFEDNGGNPFLVVDYIEGQSLDDYLAEKGTLSEDETIKLLKPIAEALDYAHGEGVIHRDVKPANIMIRKDGHPFILDFGVAREIQETMTMVTGKLSSGTLMYMSPEQVRGLAPTALQDVYSLAAVAYECLVGHPPFYRGQIEYQIVNEPVAEIAGSSSFVSCIMTALSKAPEGRPSSCGEMGFLEKLDRTVPVQPKGMQGRADESESDTVRREERKDKGESRHEDAGSKLRCCRWPKLAVWLIVVCTIGSSLFGYGAYRSEKMLAKEPEGVAAAELVVKCEQDKIKAGVFGIGAVFVLLCSLFGTVGYKVEKPEARFIINLLMMASVAGASLCCAQAAFLSEERASPTKATESYSMSEREWYIKLNSLGGFVWGTFACALCWFAASRRKDWDKQNDVAKRVACIREVSGNGEGLSDVDER